MPESFYITQQELSNLLYTYQIDTIAGSGGGEPDGTAQARIDDAIAAAEAEARSYLEAANARRETAQLSKQQYDSWKIYDTDAVFAARGTQRNPFLVRIITRIAAYNFAEIAQVDIIGERMQQQYESAIRTLEKIAGIGEYAQARIIISGLPSPAAGETGSPAAQPFRIVSNPKFTHSF